MSFGGKKRDLFVEFKENSMHVLDGEKGVEIALEREPGGRIAPASREEASRQLRDFLSAQSNTEPRKAHCSIPARGVSLRRMKIPASQQDDTQRLLAMQLEAQLPVAPAALAWGCAPLAREGKGNGSASLQDYLVAAVRKEFVADYSRLLEDAGVASEFSVAALNRRALCRTPPEQFSVLEPGPARAELASFDSRGPLALRVLPWGSEATDPRLDEILANGHGPKKLYVTGPMASKAPAANSNGEIEAIEGVFANGATAANLGLKQMVERGVRPLLLGAQESPEPRSAAPQWKWAALAISLALVALALRYAESLVFRSRLSSKLAAIATYRATLPRIDREFGILNYLKTNQPPYLDCISLLAAAAPPGTKVEALSIVRRGDLTLRGSAADAQAPGRFRSKLIDSGFFTRVVVEEQAPAPDGEKVTFRISAQLKPDGARKPLVLPGKKNSSTTNALKAAASPP